jgi:hypothetical protein
MAMGAPAGAVIAAAAVIRSGRAGQPIGLGCKTGKKHRISRYFKAKNSAFNR